MLVVVVHACALLVTRGGSRHPKRSGRRGPYMLRCNTDDVMTNPADSARAHTVQVLHQIVKRVKDLHEAG